MSNVVEMHELRIRLLASDMVLSTCRSRVQRASVQLIIRNCHAGFKIGSKFGFEMSSYKNLETDRQLLELSLQKGKLDYVSLHFHGFIME